MLFSSIALLLATCLTTSRAYSRNSTALVDPPVNSSKEGALVSNFPTSLFDGGGEDDEKTSIIDSIFDIFWDDDDDSNPLTVAPTSNPTTEIPTSLPTTEMPTSPPPTTVIPTTDPPTFTMSTTVPVITSQTDVSVEDPAMSPTESPILGRFNCTEDLRACPDGSFVSRDPRNGCNFQECSTLSSEPTMTPMESNYGEVMSLSWAFVGSFMLAVLFGIWLWSSRIIIQKGKPNDASAEFSSPKGKAFDDVEADAFEHDETLDDFLRILSKPGVTRPKILALCGSRSNNCVTKLQLENLHITADHYDIHYLHGNIIVEDDEDVDPSLATLVCGPFYSWIDATSDEALNESVVNSVRMVIGAMHTYGPFDGVYGFSHGGLIATLAANVTFDSTLQDAIRASPRSTSEHCKCNLIGDEVCLRHAATMDGEVREMDTVANAQVDPLEVVPFQFIITACAAMSAVRGLDSFACSDLFLRGGGINVTSLHLISMKDPLKTQSEHIASWFLGGKVMYHPEGHVVSREAYSDIGMIRAIYDVSHGLDYSSAHPLLEDYQEINPITSIALHPYVQVSRVQLKDDLLPSGKHGATIINCLEAQPKDNPFLFDARNANGVSTTYGQVLDFIIGGEGDLRRIGVKAGEVVAYGAPPGGGAAAALAFLSVGAQTTAAPLAPGMTEPEVLDALDQFHAKHLILFEGMDAPGVRDAFTKYAASGQVRLHSAKIIGPDMPGQFEFTSEQDPFFLSLPKLSNPENGCCLLLRTSGTTARPKGVPLDQRSLVNNSAIIAASMQLQDTDVCYSVMPLFHIGGISASILCTLVSGGSVCCDGESFDPSLMLDALAISRPQPTWYSSVPTIHNTTVAYMRERAVDDPRFAGYGISNGVWLKGHSLRMIRSGAAALLTPDAEALSEAYGGLPIYPTYSMSEQMPISQPPAGKGNTIAEKPGSVGVPVATSLAIVSRSHLRPQPWGVEGEIAISGDTVMRHYLENADADANSFFLLSSSGDSANKSLSNNSRYFLTGDVGVLDRDGYLYLKGRAKELIKKGGEQVSPYEVEEILLDHPWVRLAVCFSVPSKVYGEEVGCAVVLNNNAPIDVDHSDVTKSLRRWMKEKKFSPVKWPTKWWIGPEEDLPKTSSKKYIRVGLADKLGFGEDKVFTALQSVANAKVDWEVITGFRFVLACYVMFMHIGSNESWGHFSNLRGWPWHNHCFFVLGGFSLASPMNPVIKKKFTYFLARIGSMYPMYIIALILGLANLLVVCRPSTFDPNFHWDSQPDDDTRGFFCEGTPAFKSSYWGSLILTITTHVFGLAAVAPIWSTHWWMGYYLWFSSIYYMCLGIFPAMYNYLFVNTRKNLHLLLKLMLGIQVLNVLILTSSWFTFKHGPSYNHYDKYTGLKNEPSEYNNTHGSNPVLSNQVILSFYLFAPFWMVYFVMGGILAFIYDAYKPAERHNAFIWGYIADACTIVQIALSLIIICQPMSKDSDAERWFRPDEADYIGDSGAVSRLWDEICARIMAPLTTLWIFALSTGNGRTASILRSEFLAKILGPNAYNCYLFHQFIGQWYMAATRHGQFWNWWQFRKSFYWFSPQPCPVEWYEYFYLVLLVAGFSNVTEKYVLPIARDVTNRLTDCILRGKPEETEIDVAKRICSVIEKMTGIEPEMDSTMDEIGLASVGIPVIVGMINSAFSTKANPLSITSADVVACKTIGDVVIAVKKAMNIMAQEV